MTIQNRVFRLVNKVLPKFDQILVIGNLTSEANAIEIANYLASVIDKKIFFMAAFNFKKQIKKLLNDKIKIVSYKTFQYYYLMLTSKYIFSTHGSLIAGSSKRQIETNIWHGLLYKKIRLLRNEPGIDATYTVGTSPLSKKMFIEAFGVKPESVIITGYPRNDLMLRAKNQKDGITQKIPSHISKYNKIIFWLPTFRRVTENGRSGTYGMALNNPFQIKDFDSTAFNTLLSDNNALCLIKPHYYYSPANKFKEHSNILFIDDEWIFNKGLTLYHLLGCTDILISDYSSVIIDFLLMDKPVICFGTDIEEYKATQGIYFDDFEEWLPSKFINQQKDFFSYLQSLLKTGIDPFEEKRVRLKEVFFTYFDANSSKRLVDFIFKKHDKAEVL